MSKEITVIVVASEAKQPPCNGIASLRSQRRWFRIYNLPFEDRIAIPFSSMGFLRFAVLTFMMIETTLLAETQPFQMQANLLGVFQTAGARNYTGQLAWAPQFQLNEILGVRGELGVTLLKTVVGDLFPAANYEVLGQLSLSNLLVVEAGGGVATWIGEGGTFPIFSLDLTTRPLAAGAQFFVGYSHFAMKGRPAEEFKLGFRIGFSSEPNAEQNEPQLKTVD